MVGRRCRRWSDEPGECTGEPERLGSISFACGFPRRFTQNSFVITDDLSHVAGKHTIQMGGSLTRLQDNIAIVGLGSFVQFLSWPDFLLGLNAAQNGTQLFSNVYASVDDYGLLNREYRAWEGSAYAQDNYRISQLLTLSFGLRYERFGQFGDQLGRNSSFDMSKADPNPPPQGSTAGYIVGIELFGNHSSWRDQSWQHIRQQCRRTKHARSSHWFCLAALPNISQLLLRGGYGSITRVQPAKPFFRAFSGHRYSFGHLQCGADECSGYVSERRFPSPFRRQRRFLLFRRIPRQPPSLCPPSRLISVRHSFSSSV